MNDRALRHRRRVRLAIASAPLLIAVLPDRSEAQDPGLALERQLHQIAATLDRRQPRTAAGTAEESRPADPLPLFETMLSKHLQWLEGVVRADPIDPQEALLRRLADLRRDLLDRQPRASTAPDDRHRTGGRGAAKALPGSGIGRIEGEVGDAATGLPIPDVYVDLLDENGFRHVSAVTDLNGRFRFLELPAGRYAARVPTDQRGYLGELYDGFPCTTFDCDASLATPIDLADGAALTGIDFTLDYGGAIAGRIVDAATDRPVDQVSVQIVTAEGQVFRYGHTDALGRYAVASLPKGTFFVRTESASHSDELFDDVPCPLFDCDPTGGTGVDTDLDAVVHGIDFALRRGSQISGLVSDAETGAAIPFISLQVWVEGHDFPVAYSGTDAGGHYTIGGLDAGRYFVKTQTYGTFVDEVYDDLPCPSHPFGEPLCDPTTGTPIVLGEAELREGIDLALDPGGAITGTVRRAADQLPVSRATVRVWTADGQLLTESYTDGLGRYLIESLTPGNYFVGTETRALVDQVYDRVECDAILAGGCDPTTGTPIAVSSGTTVGGIDFALRGFGRIAGRVADAATGAPVGQIEIDVWHPDGTLLAAAFTRDDGSYEVTDLIAATYLVTTFSGGEFFDQLYDGLPCSGDGLDTCPREQGTPVEVELGETTAGIDFTLVATDPTKCRASDTTACLSRGRFRATVAWSDFTGRSGHGRLVSRSDDSALFWFFTPQNWELMVKVIEACSPPFGRFWVFSAATTNVEYTLRITDTASGEEWSYHNPPGTAAPAITDTSAFDTCRNVF